MQAMHSTFVCLYERKTCDQPLKITQHPGLSATDESAGAYGIYGIFRDHLNSVFDPHCLNWLQNAEAESLMRRARERERQGTEQDVRRENERYITKGREHETACKLATQRCSHLL